MFKTLFIFYFILKCLAGTSYFKLFILNFKVNVFILIVYTDLLLFYKYKFVTKCKYNIYISIRRVQLISSSTAYYIVTINLKFPATLSNVHVYRELIKQSIKLHIH